MPMVVASTLAQPKWFHKEPILDLDAIVNIAPSCNEVVYQFESRGGGDSLTEFESIAPSKGFLAMETRGV